MRLNLALEAFDSNIDEIITNMTTNLEHDMSITSAIHFILGKGYIADEVRKLTVEYKYNNRIKRLKRLIGYKQAKNQPVTQQGITDLMIESAKEYPIEELFDGVLKRSSKLQIGKCPFHTERSGSFVVKNNKYKCYGCGVWGDSIDFYMKQNNVNFINAVKYLSRS